MALTLLTTAELQAKGKIFIGVECLRRKPAKVSLQEAKNKQGLGGGVKRQIVAVGRLPQPLCTLTCLYREVSVQRSLDRNFSLSLGQELCSVYSTF